MTTFTTPKGTKIDLLKLKGKDYMLIAHRLLWVNEDVKSFSIDTNYLKLEDTYAICRAHVKFFNEEGRVIKEATATKKETQKDFPDFVEKCESSAIGRAVSMLGFGTAQSLADFEEGMRLADAPLEAPKSKAHYKTEIDQVISTLGNMPASFGPMNVIVATEAPERLVLATEPVKERVSSFRRDRQTTPTVVNPNTQSALTANPALPNKGGWK